jgi:osmoprotectant transport system ATP-binding protein
VIDLESVEKRWGDTLALRGVTLSIARGELVVLVGESGSGKTTTLELVNRLAEPSAGKVKVAGQDVASRDPIQLRRSIGTVFQRFALFPHMTVAENVGLVPRLVGWSQADIDGRVRELLELTGLAPDEYAARFPRALSGGQQQRVGLARALAARPEILLMDEPFGALDPVTRDTLSWECRRLHDRLGLTTMMVTHDMTEALLLADRIAVMHEGSILQVGTPEELLTAPAHPQVSALLETPRRQMASLGRLSSFGRKNDEPKPD